jgi:CDP-diglyceride synthetase
MDTAEIIRLVMALVVAPAYTVISLKVRPVPGKRALDVAVYAILASYLFNVLEDLWMKDLMVTLLLLAYGVAGVAAFLGVLTMWRAARSQGGTA